MNHFHDASFLLICFHPSIDSGIPNTLLKLLPEKVAQASPSWPIACNAKPGIGCLSVFIGLRGTSEELGLKAQNVWAFTKTDSEKVLPL